MTSRRYFIMQSALATTAILLPKVFINAGKNNSLFSSSHGRGPSVTLLHTNDLHNQLLPHSYGDFYRMGGFENTVSCISHIKTSHDNVVLLDAGDIYSGQLQDKTKYEKTLKLMMESGYDAALLGNRDYEPGTDFVQEVMHNSKLPIINSNYSFRESGMKNLHQPYKIIHKAGIKIGILGAGINMKNLAGSQVKSNIKYNEPVSEINAIATLLKKEKRCNLVICLSHLGYKNNHTIDDIKLASQSKHIDVIIGGHSHNFMQSPRIVLNIQQQEVVINHAGYGGMMLGKMNIAFDDSGNKNQVLFENLMIGNKDYKWKTNGLFS